MPLGLYLIEDQPLTVCFQMVLEFVIFLIAALLWLTWCSEHLITTNTSEAKSLAFALPSYLLGLTCLMVMRFFASRLKDKFCFSFYLASGVRFMCSAAILFPEFSREWYSVAYGFISLLCFVNSIFHIALQTNPERRPVRRLIAPDGTLNDNPPTEMMTLTQLEQYRDIIRDYMEIHGMPEEKAASAHSAEVIKVSLQGSADGYQSDRSRPGSAGRASTLNRTGTNGRNLKGSPSPSLAGYPGNRNVKSKPIVPDRASPVPQRKSPSPKKSAAVNFQFKGGQQIAAAHSPNPSSGNLVAEDSLGTILGTNKRYSTISLSQNTIGSQSPPLGSRISGRQAAQITVLETNKFQRLPFLQQASGITHNAEPIRIYGSNYSESQVHDIVRPYPQQTHKPASTEPHGLNPRPGETGSISRLTVRNTARDLKDSQALPNPSSVGKAHVSNRENWSTSKVMPNRLADRQEHIMQETSPTPCKHLAAANDSTEPKLESIQPQRLVMHQPTNTTTHTAGATPRSDYSEGQIHDVVKPYSQQTRHRSMPARTPDSHDLNHSRPGYTSMAGPVKENLKELQISPKTSPASCPRAKNATGDAHMTMTEYKISSQIAHNRNKQTTLESNQLQRCPHRRPNRPEPHNAEPIQRYRSNFSEDWMLDIIQPSTTTTRTVAQPRSRHLPTCPMHNPHTAKPEPDIAIKSAPTTPATEQNSSDNPAPR